MKKAVIAIKVIANAPKNSIVGWREDRLVIRITAVPEKGKANATLISYLAELLGIAQSAISILSGKTSSLKRLQIIGLSDAELQQLLRSR